jgi:hypothetical protein
VVVFDPISEGFSSLTRLDLFQNLFDGQAILHVFDVSLILLHQIDFCFGLRKRLCIPDPNCERLRRSCLHVM